MKLSLKNKSMHGNITIHKNSITKRADNSIETNVGFSNSLKGRGRQLDD